MSKQVRGMLTREELGQLVESGEIDTVLVVFPDLYGRFVGKRFDAEFFMEDALDHGTHGCDYLLTVDMEMEPVSGYDFANWERGYGDFHLVPDFATLRRTSWLDSTAMVICDLMDEQTHQPVLPAPRSMLRAQIEAAASMGYAAMAGSELNTSSSRIPTGKRRNPDTPDSSLRAGTSRTTICCRGAVTRYTTNGCDRR